MLELRELRPWPVLFISALFGLVIGRQAPAAPPFQTGQATITSPTAGAVVAGVVTISGTATHPQFRHFELAFAYDPNPTGVWFSIDEPAPAPVFAGILGQWDTGGITDGVYALRLRVYWSERNYIETIITDIRVENEPDLPPATATAKPTPPPPSATVMITQPLIALPPTSTPRPTAMARPTPISRTGTADSAPKLDWAALRRAFWSGVWLTLVGFGTLGIYAGLRAWLRSHRI